LKSNGEAFNLMKSIKLNYTWVSVLGVSRGIVLGFTILTSVGLGNSKQELAGAIAALILATIPILNNDSK